MDDPFHIPALTFNRQMLSGSRVIARGRGIRDVARLVREYGGTHSRWIKKSSPRLMVGVKSYEYHWYEHAGIGRREIRVKWINEP